MIRRAGRGGACFTALSQAGHSVSISARLRASRASASLFRRRSRSRRARARHVFPNPSGAALIDRIDAEKRVALIAVVGLCMRAVRYRGSHVPAIAAAGVKHRGHRAGFLELNITVAVSRAMPRARCWRFISEYQLHKIRPLADTTGREAKLTLLDSARSTGVAYSSRSSRTSPRPASI